MAGSKRSGGLLAYRIRDGALEVLLVHPGGPFWSKKDLGAWTIPKGELDDGEDHLTAARREFQEETGFASEGPFLALGSVVQKSGKRVEAWGFAGDFDVTRLVSNRIEIEWPPRTGRKLSIPEVDRGEYFGLDEAQRHINPAQIPLIFALRDALEKKSE